MRRLLRLERATWILATLVAAVAVATCEKPLVLAPTLESGSGPASFALIGVTPDSVTISVRWSAAKDPGGIAYYQWQDGLLPNFTPLIQGQTSYLADTYNITKPTIGQRHNHAFHVRAMDPTGNVGAWTLNAFYAVVYRDNAGPSAPDSIFLDTLIDITPSAAITVVAVRPSAAAVLVGGVKQLCAFARLGDGQTGILNGGDTIPECQDQYHLWLQEVGG